MSPHVSNHPLHEFIDDSPSLHAMSVHSVAYAKRDTIGQIDVSRGGLIDKCGSDDVMVERERDTVNSHNPSPVEAVMSCTGMDDDEDGDEVAILTNDCHGLAGEKLRALSAASNANYNIDLFLNCHSANHRFRYGRSSDSDVRKELKSFRDKYPIQKIRQIYSGKKPAYSCAVLAFGGMLCTIASMIAGFIPRWGSEIDLKSREMWSDLCPDSPVYSDAFTDIPNDAPKVVYMTSGFPCIEYSPRGSNLGMFGKETGWMFPKQVTIILKHKPIAIRIEQTDNCMYINNQAEIQFISDALEDLYDLHQTVIETWRFGDVTNRKRWILVGFLRETCGKHGRNFSFPMPSHDESNAPCAMHIAVPDELVPDEYWRRQHIDPHFVPYHDPQPGKLHLLAKTGTGMGWSGWPYAIYSWLGLLNTQVTTNGGGRRPPLQWWFDVPLMWTRMTVPIETMHAASLHESYDTDFVKRHCDDDSFLRKCVNNGIPIRTAVAIDSAVYAVLNAAGVPYDVNVVDANPMQACDADMRQRAYQGPLSADERGGVKCIHVDTMANATFLTPSMRQFMHNVSKCNAVIQVANAQTMQASCQGQLGMYVLNVEEHDGIPLVQPFELHAIVPPQLNRELMSIDDLYKMGFSALFKNPNYDDGVPELYKPAIGNMPAVRIPMSYDWWGSGGFRIFYVPIRSFTTHHAELLRRQLRDEQEFRGRSRVEACDAFMLSACEMACVGTKLIDHPFVEEVIHSPDMPAPTNELASNSKVRMRSTVIYAQHEQDRQIKGVQGQLRRGRNKLNLPSLHELFGHLGYCKGCKICEEIWGVMRMIKRKVNPHRELRAGYIFSCDMITWSHRSEEGNKYSMVLRCNACHVFEVLNLYLKSDATNAFESWLVETRENPLFADLPYPMCFMLKTDNDGAWSEENREWQAMIDRTKVSMYYVAPDRHAEANGFAEKACGIIEVVTKSFLAQRSLPPSWWQRCVNAAKFVLNRFPVTSQDVAFSLDGDYVRPLEILTRFWYSRRQIDRELSYFIGPGELCIVHDTDVAGSSLQPKVRWGISLGTMHYETPWFECPFSKAHYKSKSYTAYRMRSEVDCWSFLNLPRPNPSRKSMHLPIDNDVIPTVHLKEVKSFHVSDPKLLIDCRKTKGINAESNAITNPDPTSVTERSTVQGDKGSGGSVEPSQDQRVIEKGGSVIIKDNEGRLLMTDKDTGSIHYEDTQDMRMEQLMKEMDRDRNEQDTVDTTVTGTVDMPDSVEQDEVPKAVMSDSQTVLDNRHRKRVNKRKKENKEEQQKKIKSSVSKKKVVKIAEQNIEIDKSETIIPKEQTRRIENLDDWNLAN